MVVSTYNTQTKKQETASGLSGGGFSLEKTGLMR